MGNDALMPYRPTRPADPALLHASTRTSLATIRDPHGVLPTRVLMRMSHMEIRRVGDEIRVRFKAHDVDVTPRERAPRPRRRLG